MNINHNNGLKTGPSKDGVGSPLVSCCFLYFLPCNHAEMEDTLRAASAQAHSRSQCERNHTKKEPKKALNFANFSIHFLSEARKVDCEYVILVDTF